MPKAFNYGILTLVRHDLRSSSTWLNIHLVPHDTWNQPQDTVVPSIIDSPTFVNALMIFTSSLLFTISHRASLPVSLVT